MFIAIVLAIALTVSLSAAPLDWESLTDSLPQGVAEQLLEEGEVFRYDQAESGVMLLPHHFSSQVISRQHDQLDPDVLVEGLYLIPYPEGVSDIDLDVYNISRNISSISDVLYYSARREAYVPLFDDVYQVEAPNKRKALPNPFVDEIPNFESIFMHMKEVNLGSGIYEAQYVYDGESLGFFVKNATPLRMLFKIVDGEDLRINLLTYPTEKGFLVYGYCAVKLTNRNLVFKMMDPYSGFYKRLYAIETWFENSLLGTERKPEIGKRLEF